VPLRVTSNTMDAVVAHAAHRTHFARSTVTTLIEYHPVLTCRRA
jgi:hypothetical protein